MVVPGTSTVKKVATKAEDSIVKLGKSWWANSAKARAKNRQILADERSLAALAGKTDEAAAAARRSLNGRRGANIRWGAKYADDAKKAAIAGSTDAGSAVYGATKTGGHGRACCMLFEPDGSLGCLTKELTRLPPAYLSGSLPA